MTRKQVWVVGLVALVGGVVGGALVSLVVSGPEALAQGGAAQKVVTAEAFQLVAPDGTVRASLTVDEDGGVFLRLLDKEGKAGAVLAVLADGRRGLVVCDKDGKWRAFLDVSADGSPRLGLFDKDGKGGAFLNVLADGKPGLVLLDKEGKAGAGLVVEADGTARLGLFDAQGTPLWSALSRAQPPPVTYVPVPLPALPTAETSTTIVSHIDGTFEGWTGETIFNLENGQIWQQARYSYRYHYAYRPEVTIFSTSGGYKMIVAGVNEAIYVTRLK